MITNRNRPQGLSLLRAVHVLLVVLLVYPSAALTDEADVASLSFEVDLLLGALDDTDDYIFGNISSVVQDSKGHIYVADISQNVLMKFSPDGELLGSLSSIGNGPGDLMPYFVVCVDGRDLLYLAGQGGRVEIVDASFVHVGSFERANPSEIVRSVGVLADGSVAICANNMGAHTTVDLYAPDKTYVTSFSDTFANGTNIPWQVESTYAGGMLTVLAPNSLIFVQMAPYSVRKFDAAGVLIRETDNGGVKFVPEPPMPERDGDRVTFRMPAATTGVATVSGGNIVVSAHDRDDDGSAHTLFCLYDSDLNLIGRVEKDGSEFVVGEALDGKVFVVRRNDDGTQLVRATVTRVKT